MASAIPVTTRLWGAEGETLNRGLLGAHARPPRFAVTQACPVSGKSPARGRRVLIGGDSKWTPVSPPGSPADLPGVPAHGCLSSAHRGTSSLPLATHRRHRRYPLCMPRDKGNDRRGNSRGQRRGLLTSGLAWGPVPPPPPKATVAHRGRDSHGGKMGALRPACLNRCRPGPRGAGAPSLLVLRDDRADRGDLGQTPAWLGRPWAAEF